MASILPPIPRFIFTIFEPVALFAGWLAPLVNTKSFVASQVPSRLPSIPLTSTSEVLALQLSNCYGLLGMIGLGILYYTKEEIVVRNYLLACAIGDVGHLVSTYWVIGYFNFVDVHGWNATAWGNIGVTIFLFIVRILYLSGVFGKDRVVQSTKKNF